MLDVRLEAVVRDFDPLSPGQSLQAVWQVLGLGRRRAVDQDRNDANFAVKRRLDLDSHKIARIVDAAPVVLVSGRKPALSNDGHKHVAGAKAFGKIFSEIDAEGDIIDVDKDLFRSQALLQAIVDQPSKMA
jgi:hypothetical protein